MYTICLGDNKVSLAETKDLCKETVVPFGRVFLKAGAGGST